MRESQRQHQHVSDRGSTNGLGGETLALSHVSVPCMLRFVPHAALIINTSSRSNPRRSPSPAVTADSEADFPPRSGPSSAH